MVSVSFFGHLFLSLSLGLCLLVSNFLSLTLGFCLYDLCLLVSVSWSLSFGLFLLVLNFLSLSLDLFLLVPVSRSLSHGRCLSVLSIILHPSLISLSHYLSHIIFPPPLFFCVLPQVLFFLVKLNLKKFSVLILI